MLASSISCYCLFPSLYILEIHIKTELSPNEKNNVKDHFLSSFRNILEKYCLAHISKFCKVPNTKLFVPYAHKRHYFNAQYGIEKITLKSNEENKVICNCNLIINYSIILLKKQCARVIYNVIDK